MKFSIRQRLMALERLLRGSDLEQEIARRKKAERRVERIRESAKLALSHEQVITGEALGRASRAEEERDKAVEARREIEAKLESGYSFCHPENDCAGLTKWMEAEHHLNELERRAEKAERAVEVNQRERAQAEEAADRECTRADAAEQERDDYDRDIVGLRKTLRLANSRASQLEEAMRGAVEEFRRRARQARGTVEELQRRGVGVEAAPLCEEQRREIVYSVAANVLRDRLSQLSPDDGEGDGDQSPDSGLPNAREPQQQAENSTATNELLAEARQGLADFDAMGDYEAPVEVLRKIVEQQPPASESDGGGEVEAIRRRGEEILLQSGHRIEIEFDGYNPSIRLLHPEGGCTEDEEGDDCWLTDWIENEGAELLRGRLTLPVRWEAPEDRDHPLFHVLAPQPQTGPGLSEEWQHRLFEAAEKWQHRLFEAAENFEWLIDQAERLAAGEPVRNWDEILSSSRRGVADLNKLVRFADRQPTDEPSKPDAPSVPDQLAEVRRIAKCPTCKGSEGVCAECGRGESDCDCECDELKPCPRCQPALQGGGEHVCDRGWVRIGEHSWIACTTCHPGAVDGRSEPPDGTAPNRPTDPTHQDPGDGEGEWPEVLVAQDEDSGFEIVCAVGDDPEKERAAAYTQGGHKLHRYIPAPPDPQGEQGAELIAAERRRQVEAEDV